MFKKPFNYFTNKGSKSDYPAKIKVFEWKFEAPSEALLKSLSPKELKFVKSVQICEIVERNFQDEINKEICLTPEKIYKSGIKIMPNELNYQQQDLSKLNAQDARDVAKAAASFVTVLSLCNLKHLNKINIIALCFVTVLSLCNLKQ